MLLLNKKIIFIFLSFVLLLSFIPIIKCDGEEWLSGWTYRKSHVITNSADSSTGYNIKIKVNRGFGSDSENNVYLEGLCKTDFGDIAFTDNDGLTELSYWIESLTIGDSADFWIKINDNLSVSNVTIYIYFGNSEAITESNGENTFPFFDDFNGSSLNTEKWDLWTGSTITISNGELYLASTTSIRTQTSFSIRTAIHYKVNCTSDTDVRNCLWKDTDNSYRMDSMWNDFAGNPEEIQARYRDSLHSDGIIDTVSASQNIYYILENQVNETYLRFMIDNSEFALQSVDWSSSGDMDIVLLSGSSSSAYWDYVFRRNFVYPEPQNSIWGEIEEYSSPTPTNTPYSSDELEGAYMIGILGFIFAIFAILLVITKKR